MSGQRRIFAFLGARVLPPAASADQPVRACSGRTPGSTGSTGPPCWRG